MDQNKSEMIVWLVGWLVAAMFVCVAGFIIYSAMNYDAKLRAQCIEVGGVWSYGAGACVFSKGS